MGSQPQEAGGEHSLQVSDHGIVKAETLEDVLGSVSKGHLELQLQTACYSMLIFIRLFMIFRCKEWPELHEWDGRDGLKHVETC